MSETGFLKL